MVPDFSEVTGERGAWNPKFERSSTTGNWRLSRLF